MNQSIRVLLAPGRVPYIDLSNFIRENRDIEVKGVLINARKRLRNWDPNITGLNTWTYEMIHNNMRDNLVSELHRAHYERVLKSIFEDSRTYYLVERQFGSNSANTVFNHTITVERIVWNAITMFSKIQVDRMVTQNTPHTLLWFVAKVAMLIDIDIYSASKCPCQNKSWVVKGLDETVVCNMKLQNKPEKVSEISIKDEISVKDHVKTIRSDYKLAIPEYEKRRADRYKGSFFRLNIELIDLFRSIISNPAKSFELILTSIQKWRELRSYIHLAKDYEAGKNQVVLFLHYQPERTTLPEGGRFTQQWLIARMISMNLPDGWGLTIREHPSTFRNRYSRAVRKQGFYRELCDLPNAQIAPMDISPFELIDSSRVVATVTGSVGVESVLRGKPVVVFGYASYSEMPGVFRVNEGAMLHKLFDSISNGVYTMPGDKEIIDYLVWVNSNSLENNPSLNTSIAAIMLAMKISPKLHDN